MAKVVAKGTGGTDSARYCYSVWLRHLTMLADHGLDKPPETVAELGPGDSLGIGLAALLSGSSRYMALDVVRHADISRNIQIFDELIDLFRSREDIPGEKEFPLVKPYLDSYSFPSGILTDDCLSGALEESRIETIRRSILDPDSKDSIILYRAPWTDPSVLMEESIDVIYSQAVLEHVDDLPGTYQSLHRWLKPGGMISHQIDFKSHGTSTEWNGHWTYSDFAWKLIRGRRPYLLNRAPCSTHLKMQHDSGFNVVFERKVNAQNNIARNSLAERFKSLSDEDLTTSGAYIIGVKM